jgi:hypothetical protein
MAQTLALVPEFDCGKMLPRGKYKTNRQREAATKQQHQT